MGEREREGKRREHQLEKTPQSQSHDITFPDGLSSRFMTDRDANARRAERRTMEIGSGKKREE